MEHPRLSVHSSRALASSSDGHIASVRFYVGVFAALVLLTIVTVKVSYYNFGEANVLIAMLIATMKASLVAAFFMHLTHDRLFNTIIFVLAFLFLGVFFLFTVDDENTRGHIDEVNGTRVLPAKGEVAPGGMSSI
ncbi:cytochrome C oxidase subunit IV family protein [Pajaroellobacter abortibovis]|uniref:Caa(3)-type oxidase subunit IV n=1 Tax=Pajaroellobacter abortibovis TaxID=1882918 RepID=A0A1L6MVJ7_9BACT|nr:cytochrome C oxidase subunit IV family protein [Pajaroellobacter abortibovis]APR99447.1 hypothetical protein BCY86_01190 [Pajaroellobacter abortibovis]